ncbi:MAG: hypothetical protein R3D01_05175 [Hyphomicrobiales bacterium]
MTTHMITHMMKTMTTLLGVMLVAGASVATESQDEGDRAHAQAC